MGLVIRNGASDEGVGGRLCQFTDLIHWIVPHFPLTIVEHHHHNQLDLFPDFDRVRPRFQVFRFADSGAHQAQWIRPAPPVAQCYASYSRAPNTYADRVKLPRLHWATVLRGFAALAVALGAHLIGGVWFFPDLFAYATGLGADFADVGPRPSWVNLVEIVHWDAVGVSLFFLISGLVVPRALPYLSRRGVVIGRAMRILPTYAAGYLIVSAVTLANSGLTGSGSPYVWPQALAGTIPGLGTLLEIRSVPNNEWTLVVELAFYTICVLLYRRLLNDWWVGPAVALGSVALFHGASAAVSAEIAPQLVHGILILITRATPFLPVIMIGVALTASQWHKWRRWQLPVVIVFLSAAFMYTSSQPGVIFQMNENLGYRVTYLVVIAAFLVITKMNSQWRSTPVLDFLADISYSLYVTHLIIGTTIVFVALQLGVPALLATLAALAVTLAVAWVLHFSVERPSHRLGRKWSRALSRNTPVQLPAESNQQSDVPAAPGPAADA